ncbi:MAG: hypothetical protein OXC62_05295 [Aestuariivita sp.]|nr:hypothetical protein [Aestuariivita sp.]
MKKFKKGVLTTRITIDDIMRIVYLQNMNTPPDNHKLDKRLAVMEERMNIIQANLDRTLNAVQANLDKTLQEFKTNAERRDKEAVRRETASTRWIMASILAAKGLSVIILGFMLSFF